MEIKSYRDLDVWKAAMEMVTEVYKLTAIFPTHERYGLCSQLQRAAVSVPSNIAEGHARQSTRDYMRHISIALGSIAEVETQLSIACNLELASKEETDQLLNRAAGIGRQLRKLYQSLQRRVIGFSKTPAPSPESLTPAQQNR